MKRFLILLCLFFINIPALGYNSYYTYNTQPQWQIYYNDGVTHFNENNYNAAVSDFTNSIKLYANLNSYVYRGVAYYKLQYYDNSIQDLNTAISLSTKDSSLYKTRGIVKEKKKDYYGAIDDYSNAIELEPKNAEYLSLRGDAYLNVKKYYSALLDYKSSLEIANTEETRSKYISLLQDLKKVSFLIKNKRDILDDLGIGTFQLIILLFCLYVMFIDTNKDITFNDYGKINVSVHPYFKNFNINTPPPAPEQFGLNKNRINYLEKIYNQQNNNFHFNEEDSGSTIIVSLVLSLFFLRFMHVILTVYFNILNEDWLLLIEIAIPAVVLYFAIKKFYKSMQQKADVSPIECEKYPLYAKVLAFYNQKMDKLKKIEEEKQRKIREKEELILKQQKSYWQKYWSDKQKDGFNFENAVGDLYRKLGYKVKVTKGTGDGGVDLILKKDTKITIVQCKAHKHQVGPNDVRALWGVREDFSADSAIFVAYSGVTQGALDFVKGKKLMIVDVDELIRLSIQVHSEKV